MWRSSRVWDDKYMFEPEALRDSAVRAGFSRFEECNVLRRGRDSLLNAGDGFYRDIYFDWLRSIGIGELGMAWLRPIIDDLDLCIGDALLDRWPINTLFLFWK
jgi:hypothetical protein